jgi:glycosyltransferase involved in cell wall biosynthesis
MRVLNLNPAFCLRAYHQLKALSGRGFEVHLRYLGMGPSLKDVDLGFLASREEVFKERPFYHHLTRTLYPRAYKGIIKRYLRENEYDLIISHNMPDVLAAAAVEYGRLPVIFDERDMVSSFQRRLILRNYIPDRYLDRPLFHRIGMGTFYRRLVRNERTAIEGSSGRTWVSDHTYELAKERYDVPKGNNLLLYNYAGREDLKEPMEKISETVGGTHMVYAGVLSATGYRAPLLDMFERIASMGVHMHVYGLGDPPVLKEYEKAASRHHHFHFHGPVPHDRLMREMTAYDWGIVPFEPPREERDHFDTMLPNKFFDYLVCGLPVLSPRSRSMVDYIKKEGVGRIYDGVDSIPTIVEGAAPRIYRERYTIEEHLDGLVKMIGDVTR